MKAIDAEHTVEADEHPMETTRKELDAQRAEVFGALSTQPVVRRFGRYIVLDVLGRGGMGVVLKGYDDELDRQVAIKVLHEHLDERHTARLRREAQAMAKLSHPNVVQVYEVGELEGRTFVAMELCKGQTVRAWMEQQPRPDWKACVEVFLQLGAGLSAAHKRGLVHRDFKPGNAIVDEDGRARVLDFGLARREDEDAADFASEAVPVVVQRARTDRQQVVPLDQSLTRTGAVLGTPAYMPPEQMSGNEADARSDQFSFCVALYEAVYGERPYEGSSLAALVVSMQTGAVRPVPKQSRVPAALRKLLMRGLAIDPGQRWPSMEALLGELRRLVAPRARRWVAGVGLGLAAIAGVVALRQSGELSAKDEVISEQGEQLTEKEAQLARQVVALQQEQQRVSEQLAAQKGLRAKMLADDPGHELEATVLAVEALAGFDAHAGSLSAPVLEGLTHALAVLHRGIALRGHQARVLAAVVSADGRHIATASEDDSVRLWDARSGAPIRVFEGHTGDVHAVAFSPDGTRIATASRDQTVRLWAVATAEELESLPHQAAVKSVAFSPEGTRIATASGDVAWVWHRGADALVVPLLGHGGRVRSVAWSADGTWLVTASEDHTARIWDATTGAVLRTLEGHEGPVLDVAVSRDAARIFTASQDQTARSWDAATGLQMATFEHDEAVYAVAPSPDGARFATGTFDDGVARVWDLATGRRLTTARHDDAVVDIAFSPHGRHLLTASWDGTARSWDLEPSRALVALPQPHRVDAVAFSPDGSRLVTSSGDGSAWVWDPRSQAHIATLRGHRLDVLAVAFSPDGSTIATASWDGSVRLWDAHSNAHRVTLRGHVQPVHAVVFSPDGTQVATASRDGTARTWDARTGERLHAWSHEVAVVDVRFDLDGQHLLTIGADDRLRTWSAAAGEVPSRFPHAGPVTAIAFSPDGRRIAVATGDAVVHAWDVASGEEVASFRGHVAPVRSMGFSRDGTRLATASDDGTARVWGAASGEQSLAFTHERPVTSVAFSPDGTHLVTASGDEQARLWALDAGPWIEWGCAVLDGRSAHSEVTLRVCTWARAGAAVGQGEPTTLATDPAISSAADEDAPEVILVHGVELVLVPGGTFRMGSPPGEAGRLDREGPQHEVTLDGFYLARTELTNGQYALYLEANPEAARPGLWDDERFNQPEQPVVALSWSEAKAYCDWAGLSLPTEAQWEHAARAGTSTAYWFGDATEDLERFDWYDANSGARERGFEQARTRSVGTKGTNPLGLFGINGNVYEWCLDAYAPYTTPARSGDGLRAKPVGNAIRAVRSGSFDDGAQYARSAGRTKNLPGDRVFYVGLRPARSLRASH